MWRSSVRAVPGWGVAVRRLRTPTAPWRCHAWPYSVVTLPFCQSLSYRAVSSS
jgi:hypothetical protein